jgi:hypothetical protein
MKKSIFFLIALFSFLIIGNSQALSNSLCIIINKGATNPLCMFLQNIQADIGSDCADGYCAYGVQENGTLNCRICSSGGGEGVNFWQVGDGWMFPNVTAGGSNNVNVSTLKADTIYENGFSLISKYYPYTNPYNFINTSTDTNCSTIGEECWHNQVTQITDTNCSTIGQQCWNNQVIDTNCSVDNSCSLITYDSENILWSRLISIPYLYNSTNFTSDFSKQKVGNTTDEIFSVCDNGTFLKSETEPLWNGNYSLVVFNNTAGYYNISSQMCYYMNNNTYNQWLYNQTTPAINYFNSNPYNWINNSFNSTYNDYITANVSSISNNSLYFNGYPTSFFQNGTEQVNTTSDMRNAINSTGVATQLYYNISTNTSTYFNGYQTSFFKNDTYNQTYDLKFNTTATSNLNMNNYNISSVAQINLTSGICLRSNSTYKLIIESC